MKIRKATKKDIEQITPLVKSFITEHRKIQKEKLKQSVSSELKNKLRILQEDIGSGDGAILFAEEDNNVLGYVFVLTFIPPFGKPKGSPGYISDLYVAKKHRSKGIAKKLVKESMRWLKKKGKKEVLLDVNSNNKKALKLYEALNFKLKANKLSKKIR